MSSALGEPPDSGVNTPAPAGGANASRAAAATTSEATSTRRFCGRPGRKARWIITVVRPPSAPRSAARERGRALLDEGPDPLHEVVGPGQVVLDLGLQVELAIEVRIEHPVECALAAGVRTSGAGGEPGGQRLGLLQQAPVGVDRVHQA